MNKIEKFLGKSWDEYFKNVKVHSDCDTGKLNTHISKLKLNDLIHYGHYTSSWHQDFHLVVCDVCSQALLPQAFLRHFQKRHINPDGSNKLSARSNTHPQQGFKATNDDGPSVSGGGRKRQSGTKRVGLHNHHDADYQPPVVVGRRKRERLKQPAPPPPSTTTTCGQELGVKGTKRNISSPDDPLPLPTHIIADENIKGSETTGPTLSLNVTFPITQPSWLQERMDREEERSSPLLPSLKIVLRKIRSDAASLSHPSITPAPPSLPQQSPPLPPPVILTSSPPSFRVVSPCRLAPNHYTHIEDEELPLALLLSRRRRNGEQYPADDDDDSSRKKSKRSQRIRRLEKARLSLEYQIHRLKTDLSTVEEGGRGAEGDSSPPPSLERVSPRSSPPRVVTRRVPLLNHPTVVDGSRFTDSASRLQPLAYDLSSSLLTPNTSDQPVLEGHQHFSPLTSTSIARGLCPPSPASSFRGGSSVSDRASSYMSDKDSISSSTFTPHPSWNGSPHSPGGGGGSPAPPRYKHPERHSSSTDLACFAPFQHSYPHHHHHDNHRGGFGVGSVAIPLSIACLGSGATPMPLPYLSIDPGGPSLPYYPHLYCPPKLSNRGSSTPSSHHHHHAPKFAQKRQKSVHEMALFQKILELNSLAAESHHSSLDKEPCFKPSIIGPNHASPIGFSALSPSYKT